MLHCRKATIHQIFTNNQYQIIKIIDIKLIINQIITKIMKYLSSKHKQVSNKLTDLK
jgi:hypothetical protein